MEKKTVIDLEHKKNIWTGKKVKLRAFMESDGEYNFQSWNNSETLKQRDKPRLPASYAASYYFANQDAEKGPASDEFHFIIENLDGEIVGDIGTGEYDNRNGTFTFGYEIKEEHRRNGYAAEALLLVMRYYFFAMRCNKAWTSVYSYNEASNLRKLGFDKEGVQKEMMYLNGKYYDKVLYGMTYKKFVKLYGDEWRIQHTINRISSYLPDVSA